MVNTHNIEHTCCIFSTSPADIFTPSCLDPHWPAGHLRSKHISYSWYDGKSSYDGTPSYDDFPSYENFLFGIWWIAIILTIQCMMELHHIMMLIHHKLYDSYKLYYCPKEYFCEMYPTCVSSYLCEFIVCTSLNIFLMSVACIVNNFPWQRAVTVSLILRRFMLLFTGGLTYLSTLLVVWKWQTSTGTSSQKTLGRQTFEHFQLSRKKKYGKLGLNENRLQVELSGLLLQVNICLARDRQGPWCKAARFTSHLLA